MFEILALLRVQICMPRWCNILYFQGTNVHIFFVFRVWWIIQLKKVNCLEGRFKKIILVKGPDFTERTPVLDLIAWELKRSKTYEWWQQRILSHVTLSDNHQSWWRQLLWKFLQRCYRLEMSFFQLVSTVHLYTVHLAIPLEVNWIWQNLIWIPFLINCFIVGCEVS